MSIYSYFFGGSKLILLQEEEEKEEEEQARMKESKGVQEDVALKEMTIPTAREAQEQARARALEKQEQLCEISRALAVLASASVRSGLILLFMVVCALTFFSQGFIILFVLPAVGK